MGHGPPSRLRRSTGGPKRTCKGPRRNVATHLESSSCHLLIFATKFGELAFLQKYQPQLALSRHVPTYPVETSAAAEREDSWQWVVRARGNCARWYTCRRSQTQTKATQKPTADAKDFWDCCRNSSQNVTLRRPLCSATAPNECDASTSGALFTHSPPCLAGTLFQQPLLLLACGVVSQSLLRIWCWEPNTYIIEAASRREESWLAEDVLTSCPAFVQPLDLAVARLEIHLKLFNVLCNGGLDPFANPWIRWHTSERKRAHKAYGHTCPQVSTHTRAAQIVRGR